MLGLKLKGTIYGSLDDLVVSIDEEDIPFHFLTLLIVSLKTNNTSYNGLKKTMINTPLLETQTDIENHALRAQPTD